MLTPNRGIADRIAGLLSGAILVVCMIGAAALDLRLRLKRFLCRNILHRFAIRPLVGTPPPGCRWRYYCRRCYEVYAAPPRRLRLRRRRRRRVLVHIAIRPAPDDPISWTGDAWAPSEIVAAWNRVNAIRRQQAENPAPEAAPPPDDWKGLLDYMRQLDK